MIQTKTLVDVMNDLLVDHFLAVAKNFGLTKTAQELHVSRPAISRQTTPLEQELCFRLFDRTHKTMKLTAAGKPENRSSKGLQSAFQNDELDVEGP
jgi:hypothetical protein